MKKIIFLIPLLFVFSCSDKSFDPTLLSDGFKGITQTGLESPEPIGEMYDPSDWCYVKSNGLNKDAVDIVSPHYFGFYPCYPNPILQNQETTLTFSLTENSFVNLYLIDKHQRVLENIIYGHYTAGVYTVKFNATGLPKDIYRFIIETDQNTCKGDLWIK